jgi:hypothetical protein
MIPIDGPGYPRPGLPYAEDAFLFRKFGLFTHVIQNDGVYPKKWKRAGAWFDGRHSW